MERLEVGRVIRPHGLRGDVIVDLVTNRLERLAPGSSLHARLPAWESDLVVESATPHQGRHIVRFATVESRDDAERLRGAVLSAEPVEDPSALWVHELIGSVLVDADGTEHGTVVEVLANPASDLLVLEGGGLVPLTFVVERSPGRIVADLPDGLLE